MLMLFVALVLKLERRFIHTHPTLQRLLYELPVIKNLKAKKIAALVLMNEFDHIVREAREISDLYGMSHKKLVIDEILYDHDYLLRVLFLTMSFLMRISKRRFLP
jgi:hypothetical protein